MKYALPILLALFVGAAVAGTAQVRTITLVSPGGTVVIVSETPGPDGATPTLSIVAKLPDGTTLTGTAKGNPDHDGDWSCDAPLTQVQGDIDGAGILPKDRDYHLKLHANPDQDDGVPDEEGGELTFKGFQTGRGSEPLNY